MQPPDARPLPSPDDWVRVSVLLVKKDEVIARQAEMLAERERRIRLLERFENG